MSGLLEHSRILMYGRVVAGVTLGGAADDSGDSGDSEKPAATETLSGAHGADRMATIYGFEFEGHYYDLMTPAVFLVAGEGQTPGQAEAAVKTRPRLADDMKVWVYDKGDWSVRLDVSSGPLEATLLEEAIEEAAMAAETSGKRVSGKRVSGKRVSGKRMSGD